MGFCAVAVAGWISSAARAHEGDGVHRGGVFSARVIFGGAGV